MSDATILDKLRQLSPDELLSIFRAILLCEESLNHLQNSPPVLDGQLLEPLQHEFGVGDVIVSTGGEIGRGDTRQSADVRASRAA